MLEKLDEINWSELKHAYGSAEDVPDQIRSLLHPNSEIREKALWSLYGNIFHQGTRYQATPYAVPFLYELVQSDLALNRDKIILFLVNIALGYEEEYLPEGINVSDFKKEFEQAEQTLTSEERVECEKYGYSPKATLACYDQVSAGITTLLELIGHADKKIRRAAIYALAWFPEHANVSINKIKYQLNLFLDEKDISNALLSIGLLSKSSKEAFNISDLEKYLTSKSSLIRIATAISLARNPIPDNILNELISGISLDEEFKYVEDIHFNGGQISGYASLILARFGVAEKEIVIPSLCKVLQSVNSYQSLDITASLLEILNKNRIKPIKDTDLTALNKLDIMTLTTILNYGGWKLGNAEYVNFSDLLRSAGIPDSKEKLSRYLNKTVVTEKSSEQNHPKTVFTTVRTIFRQLLRLIKI